MAARIDLQGLQRQLDGFQAKFRDWAQSTVAAAEGLRDGHLARLREFQGAPRQPGVAEGLVGKRGR